MSCHHNQTDCRTTACSALDSQTSLSVSAAKQSTGLDSAVSFLRRECTRNGIECTLDYKSNANAVVVISPIVDAITDKLIFFPSLLDATGYARPRVVVEELLVDWQTDSGVSLNYHATRANPAGDLVCSAASFGILKRLNEGVQQTVVGGDGVTNTVITFPNVTYSQLFYNGDIDKAMDVVAEILNIPGYKTYGYIKTCKYVLSLYAALDGCDHGYASKLLN
jgi:hypothetical protein